jgi:hypothetical protein
MASLYDGAPLAYNPPSPSMISGMHGSCARRLDHAAYRQRARNEKS